MTREVSSVTRFGRDEPFELQVARGQIGFHESIHKFGFNNSVDTNLATVWLQGGLYSYLSSASTLYISSSSTADTAAGTGARTVTVFGLDNNFDEKIETVSLNGQTGVELNGSTWFRVNRIVVNTAGTGGGNAGVLYVGTEATPSGGVPTNKYATVGIGDNQTLMMTYTIPRGYSAYVTQKDVSASSSAGKFAILTLVARPFGGVFNVKDKVLSSEGYSTIPYPYALKFAEKTDIEIRAQADSQGGTVTVSAALDILLIQNRPYPE
tara:strand:+ start:9782 stop:10579 length:798 start_codon:yes stop_codon:yes gene_type:complete